MPNMDDIRRIARQNYAETGFQGTLTSPMCVLLLGADACEAEESIRAQLQNRWNNADHFFFLTTIQFTNETQMQQEPVSAQFPVNNKNDSYIKVQLTVAVQKIVRVFLEKSSTLNNTTICIISSSQDEESKWAGALMMMMNAELKIKHGTLLRSQLYCMLAPFNPLKQSSSTSLKNLAGGAWQSADTYKEELYAIRGSDGKITFKSLERFYVNAPVFDQIIFIGRTNSLGWTISQEEQIDMMVTLMDPSAKINWNPAGGKPHSMFTGYIFPNQLEPGADLLLTWKICQDLFKSQYGAMATTPNSTAFSTASKIMLSAYQNALNSIRDSMSRGGLIDLKGDSQKNKFEYHWICEYKHLESAVSQWKAEFMRALENVWDIQWLETNKSRMLLSVEDSIHSLQMSNTESNEKISRHIQLLNEWADRQITERKVTLTNLQTRVIQELDNSVRNVRTEFINELSGMGLDGEAIFDDRELSLQRIGIIKGPIYSDYVAQLGTTDGTKRLESFLTKAAQKLFDRNVMLTPHTMPKPVGGNPCHSASLNPGANAPASSDINQIADGKSSGRYYFVRDVSASSISDLG